MRFLLVRMIPDEGFTILGVYNVGIQSWGVFSENIMISDTFFGPQEIKSWESTSVEGTSLENMHTTSPQYSHLFYICMKIADWHCITLALPQPSDIVLIKHMCFVAPVARAFTWVDR